MSIKFSSAADGMKSEAGNDSLDTIIRQAVGKEPFLSLSRAGDSPVQWIQLLHALDKQDLPGWPLLSPVKVQMQKCEKCSREFCSTINYRRHTRLHRRSLNHDKDSAAKNRELLEVFWDKLSVDEAMDTVSFKDIMLEDVSGSSIAKALTSFIRKPGFSSLPPAYIKAGAALLDIVQGRPLRFPVSSQELFSILDEASEKTFLCAGTAESLQKYVFDGEAGKIGLEMRNLIACTSFLIEQKLVKAWLADKDAEALRCQKLLVEEEEAAQKRQAILLEKKRLKKLRQKEQKAKEQANVEALDSHKDVATAVDCHPSSSPISPQNTSDSNLHNADVTQDKLPSPYEMDQIPNVGKDSSIEPQSGSDSIYVASHNLWGVDARMSHRTGHRHLVNSHWQSPKQQRSSNGFYSAQNHHGMRPGPKQKHASHRDTRTATATNFNKVWTPKPRSETEEERHSCRLENEKTNLPDQCRNCELLIGSIAVTLANCNRQHQGTHHGQVPEFCTSETEDLHASKLNLPEKPDNRSTAKLRRPVSRHENGVTPAVDSEEHGIASGAGGQSLSTCNSDGNEGVVADEVNSAGENAERVRGLKFSSYDAEAFLARRWKEAISSDHVKLVLVQEDEAPKLPDAEGDCHEVALSSRLNVLNDSMDDCLVNSRATETLSTVKSRTKPQKCSKVYIPKQRCAA